MPKPLLTTVLMAVLAASALAQQASPKQLPLVVQRDLAEMMKMCKESGGKPVKSPGLLVVADFTGDGRPDFIIDQGAFNCDGAASLFSGSGGSHMAVYISNPDGQATLAFDSGSYGVKVNKSTVPAKIMVQVGGELCGQKVNPKMVRAELKGCLRPVDWNANTGKMQFAPVSQARSIE